MQNTGLHVLLVTLSWIALAEDFNGLCLNSELSLLSKSLQSQMVMGTCVEAGMASDFQSASQSAPPKVLRFENVNIEKKNQPANQKIKGILCSLWANPWSVFDGCYKSSKAEMLNDFDFFPVMKKEIWKRDTSLPV